MSGDGVRNVILGMQAGCCVNSDLIIYSWELMPDKSLCKTLAQVLRLVGATMCRLSAQNVSIGNRAGNGSSTVSNNTGQCNVFIGSYAGCKTRDGHSNIGIGAKAGFCISNGSINVFIGCYAGCAMTSCCGNVLIGGYGGRCSSGADNIYLGTCAGRGSSTVGNNTGGHNVAIGYQAGLSIASGTDNVFFGKQAGYYNNWWEECFYW